MSSIRSQQIYLWKSLSLLQSFKRSLFTSSPCLDRTFKTSKERKQHFEQFNSWKANSITDQNGQECIEKRDEIRIPKKKSALLIGYNGSEYQGLQSNPGVKTIEDELFKALCETGAVSKSNSDDPRKVKLMRAARTDKGVHASCNLLSLKMIISEPRLVEKLNEILLPKHIRVWGFVKTQQSFHAKNKCDSRIYEYLLPSYTLNNNCYSSERTLLKPAPGSDDDIKIMTQDGTVAKYMTRTDPKILLDYRVGRSQFDKFSQAMALFNGTHNFHNYTISRSYNDKAANRYMIQIKVDEPIVIQGMEWISVKLHGQSFMLHQIRKMISMAMLTVRTESPLSLITKTFLVDKINIPKAPALGLLLDRPVFENYNKKIMEENTKLPIDFDLYKPDIERFKKENIYKEIFEQESQENIFDSFLMVIDAHMKSDYSYFNPEGTIPEQCILKTKYSSVSPS